MFASYGVSDPNPGDSLTVEITWRQNGVVVATNTPINDRMTIHSKQAAYRSYVVAARVPAGRVTPALYWDTHDPYHYVRLQRTTNAELGGDNPQPVDLLIVGGEDMARRCGVCPLRGAQRQRCRQRPEERSGGDTRTPHVPPQLTPCRPTKGAI